MRQRIIPEIQPTWKQHLAWERLKDAVTEFITFGGGGGGGKSWLGCEWVIVWSIMYPGTKYFIGRQELKEIRQSTIPTLYKVLTHHGLKGEDIFRFNGQDNYFQFHNGSRVDLLELRYYPSDPLYERFGSLEYTSGWIEEAGEVDEMAFEMISSRTGRCMNDKYNLLGKTLLTCNPKKNFLYYNFYKPWKDKALPPNKAFIQALVDDNQYGESGYKAKLQNLKGAARERILLGKWEYENDPAALIDFNSIIDVFSNAHINEGTGYITVDVARFGDDSSVIGVWKGFRVKLHKYKGLATDQVAAKVKEHQQINQVPNSRVCIDADGIGGGVADHLKGCRQFMNGSRPLPAPVNPARDQQGNKLPENYQNLKSQTSFRMSDRINAGGVYVEIILTSEMKNDTSEAKEKELLIEEMEQVKQKDVDGEGKKAVVQKDEVKKVLGRSPDYWDTIHMREYFELKPPITSVGMKY
jgi:phage terminase large subunit